MTFEPVYMTDPMYDRLCRMISAGYPNSCVCYIDRIVNPELEERFRLYKESSQIKTELQLFHGTSEENMRAIAKTGFSVAFNRMSAYGKGTYLATRADISSRYAPPSSCELSFMLVCRAAIGHACVGTSNMEIHPTFDCAVNDQTNPTIYVMPNDDSVIPQYAIAFYKNA